MGTTVAARQVLRWTCRAAASSLLSPLRLGRSRLQPQCVGCGLFCSSSSQSTLQSKQRDYKHVSEKPVTEVSLPSLVDMGFTDTEAEQVYEAVSKVRGRGVAKHTLTALFMLGFNPSSVLKLLTKCPQLCTVKELQFQQRIDNLRKLGLVEGSLQRVVAGYPQILMVRVQTIKQVVMVLREKCLFTVRHVTDILRDSPAIVLEDVDQVQYKFQYVYYRMGVKQAEMVKSRLFRFTLDEVRCRHCFLERRGLYQTPDKKGQTIIVNPKLSSIFNTDEDTFLATIAKASAEEYDVFQRLMAREWQQQENEFDGTEADSDDYEAEEEDEEDEETGGWQGYDKRRKK